MYIQLYIRIIRLQIFLEIRKASNVHIQSVDSPRSFFWVSLIVRSTEYRRTLQTLRLFGYRQKTEWQKLNQLSSVHLVSWLTTNTAFELPILVVYTDDCRRDIDFLQADGCILNFSTSIGSHGYTHTHTWKGVAKNISKWAWDWQSITDHLKKKNWEIYKCKRIIIIQQPPHRLRNTN